MRKHIVTAGSGQGSQAKTLHVSIATSPDLYMEIITFCARSTSKYYQNFILKSLKLLYIRSNLLKETPDFCEYRGSPLSANSLSTILEVVRFINSTKSTNFPKQYDFQILKKKFFFLAEPQIKHNSVKKLVCHGLTVLICNKYIKRNILFATYCKMLLLCKLPY